MKDTLGLILCGGLGERFWPATSEKLPKYALRFDGQKTLLGATWERLEPVFGRRGLCVVTVRDHTALVRRLLPRLGRDRLWSEPARKNTAAAVTLSALRAGAEGSDPVLAFFPADALILKTAKFRRILVRAIRLARDSDSGVVMGIRPDRPATGYGYIECGKPIKGAGAFSVLKFREKPDLKTARLFLESGRFVWNAGIFIWRRSVFLAAMERFAPEYLRLFDGWNDARGSGQTAYLKRLFDRLPSLPIDKVLAEKMRPLSVINADVGWDDIGSWEALRRMTAQAHGSNAVAASGLFEDCERCLFYAGSGLRITARGLSDLLVVKEGRDLLILPRQNAEDVKRLRAQWIRTLPKLSR